MPTRKWDLERLAPLAQQRLAGTSWRELAAAEGVSPNALRMAIRDHGGTDACAAYQRLPVPVDDPPVPEADTIEARTAEARAKMERATERRLYKELLRERARTAVIVEALQSCVPALPRQASRRWAEPPPVGHRQAEEAVLVISDSQIGQWTRPEETGGLGDYNVAVFQQRAAVLRHHVRRITARHQTGESLPALNVLFAGDIVDGEAIFPNHLAHLDLDVTGQVLVAVDVFASLLIDLLELYPSIRVLSVSGNHGRTGRSKKEPGMRFRSNWDYIVAKFLETRLMQYPQISWTIPESWFAIQEICGWRFLVHHYDVIRAWMGIPYYGLDRYDKNFSRLLGALGQAYDYMIGGHFHNFADVETPVGEWIINGAWPGASYHSLRTLAAASRPSQLFFGVHPDHGITWRYRIDLLGDARVPLLHSMPSRDRVQAAVPSEDGREG